MNQYKLNSALLVMDMQTALLRALPNVAEFTGKVAKAIKKARTNGRKNDFQKNL